MKTIRQTHLTWVLSKCPKGAAALIGGKDGPSYGGALRGTAVHDFFAAYNAHLHVTERSTDWDSAERLIPEVLGRYPGLSIEERGDVTEQCRNIAANYLFDGEHYYGAEEHLETTIDLPSGEVVKVTGRLDLLLVDNAEGIATVRDVKSNHQLPPDSAIQKDLQLKIYAWLAFDNIPSLEAVRGELWFTRYSRLLPRKGEVVWTREDIQDFKGHVVAVLDAFLGARSHEAVPGGHCQYCPLRRINGCTLWRSYYGTTPPPITSDMQFAKVGRQIIVLEQRLGMLKDHAKEYVSEHGPRSIGSGEYAEVFAFRARESEEIAATELLTILEENRNLVGAQPWDELLAVKKTTRAYKNLRYHPELRLRFEDVAQKVTGSSVFGHKKPEGDDD